MFTSSLFYPRTDVAVEPAVVAEVDGLVHAVDLDAVQGSVVQKVVALPQQDLKHAANKKSKGLVLVFQGWAAGQILGNAWCPLYYNACKHKQQLAAACT